jgi:hypothetical protein
MERVNFGSSNDRARYELAVEVHEDGGGPRPARVECWISTEDDVHEGFGQKGWLPVRVDPADPSFVVVDAGD